MKFRLLIALSLLTLTACPQAGQFLGGSESFDANKTTSGGEKSTDGSSDATAIDRIISTDAPPPASSPPPVLPPPEVTGNPPPTGSGSDYQLAMFQNNRGGPNYTGPIDPKNDNEGVLTGHEYYRLRYGPDFATIVPKDASVPGSGDPYPLEKGNVLNIKLFLEKAVVNGKDQYGNDTYGWATEPDGPQVRLWFCPAGQEDCLGSYIDTKVSLSSGGENVVFSNLTMGPGRISFWIFEQVNPSPLPDWMTGMLPISYQTTSTFHEGSLTPFADQTGGEAWYTSDHFGHIGDLMVSGYVDYNRVIRSFPQSAP